MSYNASVTDEYDLGKRIVTRLDVIQPEQTWTAFTGSALDPPFEVHVKSKNTEEAKNAVSHSYAVVRLERQTTDPNHVNHKIWVDQEHLTREGDKAAHAVPVPDDTTGRNYHYPFDQFFPESGKWRYFFTIYTAAQQEEVTVNGFTRMMDVALYECVSRSIIVQDRIID